MFIEERLLYKISFGFEGGATYLTTVVELNSGYTARNAERSLPLHRFKVPFDGLTDENRALVVAAFNACKGRLHSFRFKDKADYSATSEVLGTATGDTDETMQLIKTYSFGTGSTVRNIAKPVAGTVQLYEDGVPLSSSVDTTTGIVTFTSSVGKEITADFEFDVPVRFEDDALALLLFNKSAHSVDINLVEDLAA